jgi:large subunit ribosomal protein L25
MSVQGTLNIEKRTTANSRASRKLRKNGYIPGSLSCKGKESISVAVKADDLRKGLATYGRYALFKLSIDKDNQVTGMVKEIQYSPIQNEMLHVDFQQVSLDEEIRAELLVRIKGIEILEFNKLMALRQLDKITVRGLPQDIPDEIVVDVSNVKGVENICVSNLELPAGIVPEADQEQVVISIVETRKQSETEVEEEATE